MYLSSFEQYAGAQIFAANIKLIYVFDPCSLPKAVANTTEDLNSRDKSVSDAILRN